LVNPRACHETELPVPQALPVEQRLKIGVVGSGPAGCAFAITAAQQGHEVTLYDQDDKIGGQFNMAKRIPGKEEFHETLRYFRTMLNKHGVKLQLGTTVSKEDMSSQGMHDKWVVATGVHPRDPKIPGQDHPNVLSYVDVLRHHKPVGQKVAVIGAGGIGFDVSEYLLHYTGTDHSADEVDPSAFWKYWGIDNTLRERGGLTKPARPSPPEGEREIYLLQRKKGKLGKGLGKTTGWIHRATLAHGHVEMLDGCTYEKIDENGHLHIRQGDKSRVLEVDNIVICAGQVSENHLATSQDAGAPPIFLIGGAYEAGELDAKRAIDMGTRLAMRIHETDLIPGKHVVKPEPGVEERLFALLQRFR
jgi:2,4-dienoyl-CoA reductase (NADPH2)